MKERGILFSAPMVRAILEGRKTMTRRVVKPQPGSIRWNQVVLNGYAGWTDEHGRPVKCPYGTVGDRLWVRETWRESGSNMRDDDKIPHVPCDVVYRADEEWNGPWRPSIFMPRWASRITLEVTGVRVERLQEITEEDAKAEGIWKYGDENCWKIYTPTTSFGTSSPTRSFCSLRDSINAKTYPWDSNPWCWVIEFKRITP